MLGKIKQLNSSLSYQEEKIKIPAAITGVILLLMVVPLVSWILSINREGTLATDVSKYVALVDGVLSDVLTVEAMLNNDAEALASISSTQKKNMVTLIDPESVKLKDTAPKKKATVNISLEGIYWSSANPLVGIDGETYRVGDTVHGFEIVEVGKTSVKFKSSDGTVLERGMYDSLLESGK